MFFFLFSEAAATLYTHNRYAMPVALWVPGIGYWRENRKSDVRQITSKTPKFRSVKGIF